MLETERLVLRPWEPADVDSYWRINSDREARLYLGPVRVMTRTEAKAEIAGFIEQRERLGFGHVAVVLKETGEMIGRCGAKRHPDWPLDEHNTEIGWQIAREHWGKGIATEAAMAMKAALESAPNVWQIISIAHPENRASTRVMEKLGLAYAGAVRWESRGVDIVYYSDGRPRRAG